MHVGHGPAAAPVHAVPPVLVEEDEVHRRAPVHLFVDTDLLSLVFPFEPGTYVTANFMWTGEAHAFTSEWPRGAPKPPRMGIFERVDTPRP